MQEALLGKSLITNITDFELKGACLPFFDVQKANPKLK